MKRPPAATPATAEMALRAAQRRLAGAKLHYGHGTHSAHEDAEWLVSHAFGLEPGELGRHLNETVTPARRRRIDALLDRRIRERVPAAYLTGQAWLGEFAFKVDRRVIVPRSFIAELLRDGLRPWMRRPVRRALDLCTGSGCLAVLLAHAFPRARIDATDISRGSLAVAAANVARYRLAPRIRLMRGDLFDGLQGERFQVIVANPPYVTARSMKRLPREHRHEPTLALGGGEDGLELVRRILAGAHEHLSPDGVLVCEIGHNRVALERAYPRLPFTWLETSAGPEFVFLVEREHLTRANTATAPQNNAARSRSSRGRPAARAHG